MRKEKNRPQSGEIALTTYHQRKLTPQRQKWLAKLTGPTTTLLHPNGHPQKHEKLEREQGEERKERR